MNIMRSMRGAVAVLVGLTLISGAVAIGSWGGVPRPLLAGPTIHDFGVVDLPPEESDELKHVFRLTNDSGTILRIHAVSSTCGCVAAKPEETIVLPGRAFDLSVSTKVMTSGRMVQGIRITFEDGRSHELHVAATGRRLKQLKALPASLAASKDHPTEVVLTALDYLTDDRPDVPNLSPASGASAEFAGWTLIHGRDAGTGRAARWEGVLRLSAREIPLPTGVLTIETPGFGSVKLNVRH